MDYLELLKSELNVNENLEVYKDDFKYIDEFLISNNININKLFKVQFANHIYMLIQRLKENSLSSDPSLENFDVDKECYDKAEELLNPLFKKYKVKTNNLEIKLISIYFQTAKGGFENE